LNAAYQIQVAIFTIEPVNSASGPAPLQFGNASANLFVAQVEFLGRRATTRNLKSG